MKRARVLLIIFGLLDAVLLGHCMRSIYIPHWRSGPPWWFNALMYPQPFFVLSLAASALGLVMQKRWGILLSYAQFPFRILYVTLSFGWLTLLTTPLLGRETYQATLVAAIGLEALRLTATIVIHVKSVRQSR